MIIIAFVVVVLAVVYQRFYNKPKAGKKVEKAAAK
jgi:hypothetical protein